MFATVYVDDILITSATWDEHCNRIELVLRKLYQNNLTLKLDKSKFITQELPFLGFILSETGIKPSPEKVEVIQNFPKPKNIRHLQSFLGICNYYRKFQQNYSELTAKFQHLLSSKNKWKWGKPEDDNFSLIKSKFLNSAVLHHLDFNKRFYLNCDVLQRQPRCRIVSGRRGGQSLGG